MCYSSGNDFVYSQSCHRNWRQLGKQDQMRRGRFPFPEDFSNPRRDPKVERMQQLCMYHSAILWAWGSRSLTSCRADPRRMDAGAENVSKWSSRAHWKSGIIPGYLIPANLVLCSVQSAWLDIEGKQPQLPRVTNMTHASAVASQARVDFQEFQAVHHVRVQKSWLLLQNQ